MDLFDLSGENEEDHAYLLMEANNLLRLDHFVGSLIDVAMHVEKPFLSTYIIQLANTHAVSCLHSYAGQWRPYDVAVGQHTPEDDGGLCPRASRIPYLMNDFINTVNFRWHSSDAVQLACYVLWKINFIHPFVNGNGRTARAMSYFVLCTKMGRKMQTPLPSLISDDPQRYSRYVELVQDAHQHYRLDGLGGHLRALQNFYTQLVLRYGG